MIPLRGNIFDIKSCLLGWEKNMICTERCKPLDEARFEYSNDLSMSLRLSLHSLSSLQLKKFKSSSHCAILLSFHFRRLLEYFQLRKLGYCYWAHVVKTMSSKQNLSRLISKMVFLGDATSRYVSNNFPLTLSLSLCVRCMRLLWPCSSQWWPQFSCSHLLRPCRCCWA